MNSYAEVAQAFATLANRPSATREQHLARLAASQRSQKRTDCDILRIYRAEMPATRMRHMVTARTVRHGVVR